MWVDSIVTVGCYDPGMSPPVAPIPVPCAQERGHARIDARSLAMHRAIAAKLIAEPGLLAIAQDNIERWTATAGRSQPYLDAWRELLAKPTAELAARIQEDSEMMRSMRQTSPFAGVLSPRERWEIYDAAGTIADDDDIVVIGRQAILGQFPAAPAELLVAREADVYPRVRTERADLIDGSIGEGSPFEREYGYLTWANRENRISPGG